VAGALVEGAHVVAHYVAGVPGTRESAASASVAAASAAFSSVTASCV